MAMRHKDSAARGANAAGLALALLVVLSEALRLLGGLLPVYAEPGRTEWAQGIFGIVLRVGSTLPPILLLRRYAARRPHAADVKPMRAASLAGAFLLFIGAAAGANLLMSLLRLWLRAAAGLGAEATTALPVTAPGLVLFFVSSCVVAPLMEELLFRGGVQPLLRPWGLRPAALLASAAFALMHGSLWELPVVFLMSLMLCLVRELYGALWPCVLLHAANNALAFLLLAGRWPGLPGWLPWAACGAVAVLCAAGGLALWRRRSVVPPSIVAQPAAGAGQKSRLGTAPFMMAGLALLALQFLLRLL